MGARGSVPETKTAPLSPTNIRKYKKPYIIYIKYITIGYIDTNTWYIRSDMYMLSNIVLVYLLVRYDMPSWMQVFVALELVVQVWQTLKGFLLGLSETE